MEDAFSKDRREISLGTVFSFLPATGGTDNSARLYYFGAGGVKVPFLFAD